MRAFRPVIGAALCVTAVVGATSASASTSTTYYLVGDTKPFGSLSTSSPPNIPLPNFDPERDNHPGLYLDQTDKGMAETDEKKFQQWSIGAAGLQTSGAASFRVWAAAKDLNDDKDQVLDAYFLDCAGSACMVLDQKRLAFTSSTNWSQLDFTFASMSHTFASGRSLAIRVIVPNASEDDMWLAYATASYPARVTVPQGASTTTTTAPTTTSTISATTTSTNSAPTTTTTAATTTTKPSSGSTTSSSSTSTSLGETSTTTTPPSETTVDSQGAPITPPTTTTLPPADARPVDTAREKTTLVVSAAAEGITAGLVNDTDLGTISPQEGLMVSFLSAAEAVKSQILASVALGILGAALLLLAMRRRRDDDEEATEALA